MILGCYKSNGCSDKFYLPDIHNIDILKTYAENNIPIKCYECYYIHSGNVYILEEMVECYLYLNNYLYYKNMSDKYIALSFEECDKYYKKLCKHCSNDSSYGCEKRMYILNDDCMNFIKKKSITEWITQLLK